MWRTTDPETLSQTFLTRVQECCEELLQPSWTLQASQYSTRPPLHASKFGGCTPWVSAGWKWPSCTKCSRAMSFLCQINLADMPFELQARVNLTSGLFQSFFCSKCTVRSSLNSVLGIEAFEGGIDEVRMVPQKEIESEVNSLRYLSAVASRNCDITDLPAELQKFHQTIWHPNSTMLTISQAQKTILPDIFEEHFLAPEWVRSGSLEIPCFEEIVQDKDIMTKLRLSDDDVLLSVGVIEGYHDKEDLREGRRTRRITVGDKEIDIGLPQSGMKAGGWIDWNLQTRLHGNYPGNVLNYPNCLFCPDSPRMDVVFLQIEGGNELFNACGRMMGAHVTLCPECRRPALKWYFKNSS